MNKFLLKMIDGGLINIETDKDQEWSGCETCDYGSKYISNIDLYLTKYEVYIILGDMYYPPSVDDLIKVLIEVDMINNMTELEFIEYVKKSVQHFYSKRELEYDPEIKVIDKRLSM